MNVKLRVYCDGVIAHKTWADGILLLLLFESPAAGCCYINRQVKILVGGIYYSYYTPTLGVRS